MTHPSIITTCFNGKRYNWRLTFSCFVYLQDFLFSFYSFRIFGILSFYKVQGKSSSHQRPRPHVSVYVWKRWIFSPVLPSGENGHLKRIFSKTLPRVESFENAGFSFIYGRSKRGVFEYDNVISHILLALRMLCEECCRISIVLAFSYERAKTIRIRYIWTRFQNYSDTCGWALSE